MEKDQSQSKPASPEEQASEGFAAVNGSHPPAPARFEMGDGRRFHWRRCDRNGQEEYEVYSIGLETWATCYLPTEAAAVADGLELLYANDEVSHGSAEKKL